MVPVRGIAGQPQWCGARGARCGGRHCALGRARFLRRLREEPPFDLVTLDTGDAPDVVKHVPDLLVPGGYVAVYSPFVESTRSVVEAARDAGLADVRTLETIQREMTFDDRGSRPSTRGVGHTGYLTIARNREATVTDS